MTSIFKSKILIVDDSELSRISISNILQTEGFHVIGTASGAQEAIDLAQSLKPNLIILDIVMPEMSGIELTKLLIKMNPDVNIVTMSSLEMEEVVIESIASGAIEFLKKPFTREDLLRICGKIETLINNT